MYRVTMIRIPCTAAGWRRASSYAITLGRLRSWGSAGRAPSTGPTSSPTAPSIGGKKQLEVFWETAPFDGIWVDMNEPSNFCTGDVCEVDPTPACESVNSSGGNGAILNSTLGRWNSWWNSCSLQQAWQDFRKQLGTNLEQVIGREAFFRLVGVQQVDGVQCPLKCRNVNQTGSPAAYAKANPPYRIFNILGDNRTHAHLNTYTVPVTAWHLDNISSYNAHNLYGHSMARATHLSLKRFLKKRFFLLSRSTFTGSGAFTAHWTGDSQASWEGLRATIPQMMANGLQGIPFVGADICGFDGSASEELCARWVAMGAFYPFSRAHHSSGNVNAYQELYRWEKVKLVAQAALARRYTLLHYLYTTFFFSSVSGGPVMKPLFFAAPRDAAARQASYQFMWGDALLVAPVVTEGHTSVDAYFPAGRWYDFNSQLSWTSKGEARRVQQRVSEPAPLFVAGGHIIPLASAAMTTNEVMASKIRLLVALPEEEPQLLRTTGSTCEAAPYAACGHLYVDDGEQLETGSARENLITFRASQGPMGGRLQIRFEGNPLNVTAACTTGNPPVPITVISEIIVLGARSAATFAVIALRPGQPSHTMLGPSRQLPSGVSPDVDKGSIDRVAEFPVGAPAAAVGSAETAAERTSTDVGAEDTLKPPEGDREMPSPAAQPQGLSSMTPGPANGNQQSKFDLEERNNTIATPGTLIYDKANRVLTLRNLNVRVPCPMGYEITWS
eukprot:jgi/Botrbrau1/19198/Bobra.0077s0101.1